MPSQHDNRKTVVIVEDDASLGRAMARVLRVAGLDSAVFASAEALLAADGVERAACLVIDVRLPGMDGFALRDRLADTGRLGPVVFITAFDDPETRAQAGKAGATAFLAKPFTGRVLVDTVRRATAA
jgi:FixJ family two-component response regulator